MIVSDIIADHHEAKLADDPALCQMIREKWNVIPRFWSGVFAQCSHGKPITLADKYVALRCYAAVEMGALWFNPIQVSSGPHADCEVDANNAILAELAPDYDATFEPGGTTIAGASDGYFSWEGEDQGFIGEKEAPMSCRGSLPLEVGTTSAGKTYLYLHKCAGLVRWPYGSNLLYVFHRNCGHPMWQDATPPPPDNA